MSISTNHLQFIEKVVQEEDVSETNTIDEKFQIENEDDYYKINIKEAIIEVLVVINL